MFKAGIGSGVGTDTYKEAANAAFTAVKELGTIPQAVMVFASVAYDQEKVIEGVRSVIGDALLVGCSTAGEITTAGPSSKSSIAVMAFASDTVSFFGAVGEGIAQGAKEAGKAVAINMKEVAGGMVDVFMMMPDVLVGNGADIVRGASEILGKNFPIIGGAAGDDFKFEKTFQYLGHGKGSDKVYSGAVVALGMKGPIALGIGVKHGWMPIGLPRKVTRATGTVLYELDHKPAIGIYEDYFGDKAKELKEEKLASLAVMYPLGMKIKGREEMLIRDPLMVDQSGSITCAAEIPEGSEVQLMLGSHEEAVTVAKLAATEALAGLGGRLPVASVIFNCIARRKLFGERSGEEIKAIQSVIGNTLPLIGFYTYGEQAPIEGSNRNLKSCPAEFHNETVVICLLAEK